jgi:uncharacterized protein (TIGR02444 family)
MTDPHHHRDNALWRFSLRVYAAPGVAAECLALQAAHNVDVNLLLFSAWAGAERGWRLAASDLEQMRQAVHQWQETVVRPLRSARRAIKTLGVQSQAASDLRARIAADELEAERIEQALLFALAEEVGLGNADAAKDRLRIVRDNAALLVEGCAGALPEALIAAAVGTAPVD